MTKDDLTLLKVASLLEAVADMTPNPFGGSGPSERFSSLPTALLDAGITTQEVKDLAAKVRSAINNSSTVAIGRAASGVYTVLPQIVSMLGGIFK